MWRWGRCGDRLVRVQMCGRQVRGRRLGAQVWGCKCVGAGVRVQARGAGVGKCMSPLSLSHTLT